jgi:hypothetical protein
MTVPETRPRPHDVNDETTLRRWYWLRAELVEIARRVGAPTSEAKLDLLEQIAARLSARTPPPRRARPRSGDTLPPAITARAVIHPGQRCTQALRMWMRSQVGPRFAFDAPMRDAVATGGITAGDLVGLWHSSRDRALEEPSTQFELNRYARQWHAAHPGGSHAEMLAGWRAHRSSPRDPTAPHAETLHDAGAA